LLLLLTVLHPAHLLSFPTRRSSDLTTIVPVRRIRCPKVCFMSTRSSCVYGIISVFLFKIPSSRMILLSVMTYRVVLRFSSAMMNATRAMNTKNAARIVLVDKLPTVGLLIDEKSHGSRRASAPAMMRARTINDHHRRPSIRSSRKLQRVVVCHSEQVKSREGRAKVMEFCRSLGVAASAVEVSDAFDLLHVAGEIRADVRKERAAGSDLRFNIAGGTR